MTAETDSTRIAGKASAEPKKDAGFEKKRIVVALLLIGFIVAILTQPGQDDAPMDPIVGPALANRAVTTLNTRSSLQNPPSPTAKPESANARIQRLRQVRPLSRIELEDIRNLELFAPEPLRDSLEWVNETQRVQAVYGTSSGHAALLGESILRSGQRLPHGGRVLQVTTDGIQVAP